MFPFERSLASPLVRDLLEKLGGKAEPTPAGIKAALEGFRKVDIGGLEVTYSASDHTGLDYADLAIIGADGRFKR